MIMQPLDMRPVLKGRKGWVLLSRDYKKVIAEAKTLKALLRKTKKMGNPDGILMIAGKDYSNFIG